VVAIDARDRAGRPGGPRAEHPAVIGDASRWRRYGAASVDTCRSLVVLSTDDVTKPEAAAARPRAQRGSAVVLRLFDGDFADRYRRPSG